MVYYTDEKETYIVKGGDYITPVWKTFVSTLPVMLVPAVIYSLQNQFNVIAGGFLPSSALVAVQQFKVITTGVFTVLVLRRKLTLRQWGSLIFLTVGVLLIALPSDTFAPSTIVALFRGASSASVTTASSSALPKAGQLAKMSPSSSLKSSGGLLLGFLFGGAASIMSGFAGVWTEMYLKKATVGIYLRNVQLGMGGAAVALLAGLITERGDAFTNLFVCFGLYTWILLSLNVMSGFLIALALKYASAILKNFSAGASVATTVFASWPIFGENITASALVGSAIITASIYWYSTPPAAPRPAPRTPPAAPAGVQGTGEGNNLLPK